MELSEVVNYFNQYGLDETLAYFDIDVIYKELKGKNR